MMAAHWKFELDVPVSGHRGGFAREACGRNLLKRDEEGWKR
jgi:hypothetical protein